MNRIFFKCVAVFLLLACVSCQRHRREVALLTAERDTLQARYTRQEVQFATLKAYVDDISSTLDSIAIKEDMLFLPDPETPHVPLTKRQIQKRLEDFQELILRQHDKIVAIEDELAESNAELRNVRTMVAYFKTQIEVKDAEISEMKKELSRKNANIKVLESQVTTLRKDMFSLHADIDTLERRNELLEKESGKLYEAFYIMGTRNELFKKGIVRNSTVVSSLDLNQFERVDKREFTELVLPSSKVRILTQCPSDSYSLAKGEDGNLILKVNDTDRFWSISQVLVIQLR